MSSNDEHIAEAASLIRKDFGIDSSELEDYTLLNELKSRLTRIVSYLLDNDFERLLQAMYRIDISERKFKAALNLNPASEVASSIAQLIIERELQKVATRRKYS